MKKNIIRLVFAVAVIFIISCASLKINKAAGDSKAEVKKSEESKSADEGNKNLTDDEKAKRDKEERRKAAIEQAKKHYNERIEIFKVENEKIKKSSDKNWKSQIVMLGDSLTEGFNLEKAFPGRPFVNRGIVSDHIKWLDEKGLLYRITPDVLAPNPSHIFILIGVNELGDSTDNIDEYIQNYSDLLKELRIKYPKTRLAVESLLPARGKYAKLNPAINEFNLKLKALAQNQNIMYIELNSLMKDANGDLKEEFTRDGLHLKEDAYKIWANVILEKIDGK